MNYLNREDIITYENNKEYVVIDSVIIDNENFVYLIQKDDPKNQLFARVTEENEKLKVDELDMSSENNKEIISKILEELTTHMYEDFKEAGVIDNESGN